MKKIVLSACLLVGSLMAQEKPLMQPFDMMVKDKGSDVSVDNANLWAEVAQENKLEDLEKKSQMQALEIKRLKQQLLKKELRIQELTQMLNTTTMSKRVKEEPKKAEAVVMKKQMPVQEKNMRVGPLEKMQAGVFVITADAKLYDKPGGKAVSSWKAKRMFTSNVKAGDFIKMTGYFEGPYWKPLKTKYWILESNTKKRR